MMQTPNLWDKLTPQPHNIETLKKDLSEGKTPELPFFIVDQQNVKDVISTKINSIEGDRMQTSFILASYGNGKTNLLKYLQLYFKDSENRKVIYTRADVDQPDVVLFLLKEIQDRLTDTLVSSVQQLRATVDVKTLANNFEDNFSAIREYSEKLFSQDKDANEIKRLIYLGTGRLYTKGEFSKFELEQLSNYNRREVFVLFLNILAQQKEYLIFAVDEVERILDKSKIRFNQFLSSYRELIDLFNKVHGHYLISCFTTQAQNILEEINPAFNRRIQSDVSELMVIQDKPDIKQLVDYLDELFDTQKDEVSKEKIINVITQKGHQKNAFLVRHTIELLLDTEEKKSLEELLLEEDLSSLFTETANVLKLDGSFKNLHQKFFDPLEHFLISNHYFINESEANRREKIPKQAKKAFIDDVNNKVHFFIFNDESEDETINSKVNELVNEYDRDIIIYSPIKNELSNSAIELDAGYKFEIVDYDPEALFVLLNMYRDNFDRQDHIGKVISQYTDKNLNHV